MAGLKKWLLVPALLLCMACSGCTTFWLVVGGIWAADQAVKVAGGVVEGTGKMLTDKQTRFDRAASVDSKRGTITLAKSEFTPQRVSKMIDKLEVTFSDNDWSHILLKKEKPTRRTDISESWECLEALGAKFELTFKTPKNRDTQITVKTEGLDDTIKDEITAQIFDWIKEAALAT